MTEVLSSNKHWDTYHNWKAAYIKPVLFCAYSQQSAWRIECVQPVIVFSMQTASGMHRPMSKLYASAPTDQTANSKQRTCSRILVVRWHSPSHCHNITTLLSQKVPFLPDIDINLPPQAYWEEEDKGRLDLPLHVESKDWSNCPLPPWHWLTKEKEQPLSGSNL